MSIKIWCFVTLLFTALSMALAFGGHLLQLPPHMSYDAALWRTTQSMYQLYGPPVGAIIEGGAWLTAPPRLALDGDRRGLLCAGAGHLVALGLSGESAHGELDASYHAARLDALACAVGVHSCRARPLADRRAGGADRFCAGRNAG